MRLRIDGRFLKPRDHLIYGLRREGRTLRSIGSIVDLCGERVRSILLDLESNMSVTRSKVHPAGYLGRIQDLPGDEEWRDRWIEEDLP
jgi:hypothetical protein